MITTLEDIRVEQQLQQVARLLESLPLEARVNLCAQGLLLGLAEMQQLAQRPLGTAAHMTLSQEQRPIATLLAFAGSGSPQIAGILAGLVQDIKNAENQLAGGNNE